MVGKEVAMPLTEPYVPEWVRLWPLLSGLIFAMVLWGTSGFHKNRRVWCRAIAFGVLFTPFPKINLPMVLFVLVLPPMAGSWWWILVPLMAIAVVSLVAAVVIVNLFDVT